MRILFLAGGAKFHLRRYAPLVSELVDRGHEVHLLFKPSKLDESEFEARATDSPRVTCGVAPGRDQLDGWRPVAWLVRGLADLARYSHPRYAQAHVLRTRMTEKTLHHLERSHDFEPLARRLALRLARRLASTTDAGLSDRVIRWLARLERAIPTSAVVDRYLREQAPDLVLATPLVNQASPQVEFLKSARRLRIPTGILVASWDNLTNKGLLKWVPERVFVWNEIQRREAIEQHGIPPERVVATGAQLFDPWFEQRPSTSREEFVRTIGLDHARPYLLYTCSNPQMTEVPETDFVVRWLEAVRASDDERIRRLGIVIRPHPSGPGEWRGVDLSRFENVVVWPREGDLPVTAAGRTTFFDSLAHSVAVVGINTTAMIEAAIVGKSVLSVLAAEFAQETTLHFHYLLEENGGFLHVASSLDEHVGQLGRVLDEDRAGAGRRRRFVESFVRPGGLGRPATPILADAVEELASVEVDRPAGFSLLRVPLALEAALSARSLRTDRRRRKRRELARPRRRRMRHLRRRLVAKVRAVAR